MFRKIIAAVDGSFHSELASRYAVAIAASCSSELSVLAIDTGEVEQEKLSSAVERICQYAEDRGVKASGIVRKGEAVKTILAAVYAENADLLVAATRKSDYRRFVRSVTQKLMLRAPCSMLAVKPAGITLEGKSMLLPVERRELVTDEQVMLTVGIAKFYSFKVEILHVVERRHWYDLPWERLYTMRHHGEENMMPVAKALAVKGVSVEVRAVVAESSAGAVLKEAAIGKHSLVLLRTGQRNVLKQAIAGNPVEQMLSSILCDVLIWRPKP